MSAVDLAKQCTYAVPYKVKFLGIGSRVISLVDMSTAHSTYMYIHKAVSFLEFDIQWLYDFLLSGFCQHFLKGDLHKVYCPPCHSGSQRPPSWPLMTAHLLSCFQLIKEDFNESYCPPCHPGSHRNHALTFNDCPSPSLKKGLPHQRQPPLPGALKHRAMKIGDQYGLQRNVTIWPHEPYYLSL